MALSQNPSLTEQVMDYVRRAVDSGEMVTGAWYSVYQLSEVLGISRSPVRDGLLRLEEAGLVRFTRNRGFQIVETTPTDVAEIFSLRLAIEPPTAFRAARHRTSEHLAEADRLLGLLDTAAEEEDAAAFFAHDEQLHDLLLKMGNSSRGREIVSRLRTHTRLLGVSTAGTSRSLRDIYAEHLPVLDAIRDRDADAARARLHEHLTVTGQLLVAQSLRQGGVAEPDLAAEVTRVWDSHAAGSLP